MVDILFTDYKMGREEQIEMDIMGGLSKEKEASLTRILFAASRKPQLRWQAFLFGNWADTDDTGIQQMNKQPS